MNHPTFYRTLQIDGLSIFYREAGPKDAPTLLLLHGLPSSSRMFEPLFARLSNRYHLVAPDYPGFGHSDWPDPRQFAYTFDHYAEIMNHFTEALGLSRYTLYMQDYGGPVGFRMALAHPNRIKALIVQDAVAYNEGLGANWKPRLAFWADRAANESTLRTNLLSLPTTRTRHVGNDPNVERYNPDLWIDEFAFLNQPGQGDIQSDLFYDYRTNVDAYPKWQAWMREKQPRLLVIWGKYDLSFDRSEPEAYRRDVPNAQVHVLDAGHFALDTAADEIAALIRGFVGSSRGIEAAADWGSLRSPENYIGYERTESFASPGGVVFDTHRVYAAPVRLRLNQWALAGDWTVQKQATVLNQANGKIVYRFHARDLHLVMGPAARGTSVRFRVLVDGQPPGAPHGSAVDDQGNGTVSEQRLYQLIRQPQPIADRLFEIAFLDPGVEAYAFTFG